MNFVRINDFPDYVIHPCGTILRIWKTKTRELKPWSDGHYLTLTLCRTGFRQNATIHRLIATHFIPNPNNLPCVDHINRNKTDNRITNLRWASYSTNNRNKTLNTITKGGIYYKKNKKTGYNIWIWEYKMSGITKRKCNVIKEALEKYRIELLKKYNIVI
tara:strand:+ start:222 stop:701 length:480 start_codon:yes stop_codon:yes gene_type:complete